MRISGGAFKGRVLGALPARSGQPVRPTSDKVRQALFNMLAARGYPEGCCALDLFCGTGALGIEALSRGAAFCVFQDIAREAIALAGRNLAQCGADPDSYCLLHADSSRTASGRTPAPAQPLPPADLVFLDPPYRKDLALPALQAAARAGRVQADFLCVLEQAADEPLPALPEAVIDQERRYGGTRLVLARLQSAALTTGRAPNSAGSSRPET